MGQALFGEVAASVLPIMAGSAGAQPSTVSEANRRTAPGRLTKGIAVKPSAVLELGWVLYRLRRAELFGETLELVQGKEPSAQLVRHVNEFWSDAARNFDEFFVIAQWGGALFDLNPTDLFDRMPDILKSGAFQELALSSERPDERAALERRIQRLTREPELLAAYITMLDEAWRYIQVEWRTVGLRTSRDACRAWRSSLADGTELTAMLAPDHALFQVGLVPLLQAALAKHEVTLSPLYYCLRGHVCDLPGALSVGVAALAPSTRNAYGSRGRVVASYARVVANPSRAAVLAVLLDTSASVRELTLATGIAATTVRAHLGVLKTAGMIQVTPGPPQRFRVVETGVDALFNEMSARIRRGHGRSTMLHATEVAQGASFRAIFDGAPIAIIQFDLRGRCLSCNPETQRIFGYSEVEMSQLRGAHLVAEVVDRDAFAAFDEGSGPLRRSEVRLRRKDASSVLELRDCVGRLRRAGCNALHVCHGGGPV